VFRELGLGPGGAERHLRRAAVKSPIPLFLISFNRGEALRATIDGARRLEADLAIVVRDNGSDDAATLAVLRDLETSGVTVVRRGPISHADELNRVDDDVANYFRDRPPSRYLVSDCDIDLSVADPGALRKRRADAAHLRRAPLVPAVQPCDEPPCAALLASPTEHRRY